MAIGSFSTVPVSTSYPQQRQGVQPQQQQPQQQAQAQQQDLGSASSQAQTAVASHVAVTGQQSAVPGNQNGTGRATGNDKRGNTTGSRASEEEGEEKPASGSATRYTSNPYGATNPFAPKGMNISAAGRGIVEETDDNDDNIPVSGSSPRAGAAAGGMTGNEDTLRFLHDVSFAIDSAYKIFGINMQDNQTIKGANQLPGAYVAGLYQPIDDVTSEPTTSLAA